LYWNPSGISQIQRVQLLASQNFWFLDMSYQYVALVIPSSVGTIGISGAYSSSGKIPKYEDFQRIGDYNAFDIAGTLGYCKNLGILSFGITGKYIQQTIDDVVASGYAFDAGLLFKLSKIFKVGLVVQTIGTEIKFT
ncbi:MAG TPA: hypothetical protein VGD14_08950, partial [bacterium]